MSSESLPGLYLHVPFCSAICPYCDFAVHTGSEERRTRFVDSLLRELALVDDWESFGTVYFGGGTPSILGVDALARILETLRERFALDDPWISLEANPEDVTADSVRAWRELGVRTLSLGVQSFRDDELRFLGRRHDEREATASVGIALQAGFDIVTVDLIYGLPDQSPEQAGESRARLASLRPRHISCYQLTVTEGTAFGRFRERGKLKELGDDAQANHFLATHRELAELSYPAYEVSNFAAREEHRSRHNRKYWDHVPYLGVGPSAHSYRGTERWWNLRDTREWSEALERGERPVEERERLEQSDLALETLMLGFRQPEGVDLARYQDRFGYDLREREGERIARQVERGLLRLTDTHLLPTEQGLAVADGLAASFTRL